MSDAIRPPEMTIEYCQYEKPGGKRCGNRVKSGQKYCHQHTLLRRLQRRLRPSSLIKTGGRIGVAIVLLGVLVSATRVVFDIIGATADLYSLDIIHRRPERMSGSFNIAVAGFTIDNARTNEDTAESLQTVDRYLENIHRAVQHDVNEIVSDYVITVWGPDRVSKMKSQDRVGRLKEAEAIAGNLGADVVIYGSIAVSGTQSYLFPEFYISSRNFYEAQELTGVHQLGKGIPIRGAGSPADRITLNRELASRVQVLSHIVVGLSFFGIGESAESLRYYEMARNVEGWEDMNGRQVVDLLSGTAAMADGNLDLADDYYRASITKDSEYARGYLGVANVFYKRAQVPFEISGAPMDTDTDLLVLALEALKSAAQAEHQSPEADISTKLHFARGQILFLDVYAKERDDFHTAISEFEAVIADYANGANPRLQELAAEAHARLALIYALTNQPKESAQEYLLAASLLDDNSDRQKLFEGRAQEVGTGPVNLP